MNISVVIPLLNEEESLPELCVWIDKVMLANNYSYELILVDDGSRDKSWSVIESLAEKNKQNPKMIQRPDGAKAWYVNGERHREDGPAYDGSDGSKVWYLNGEIHREDGPAVERSNGYKAWYLNGKCHREDGPASEWPDGREEWWLNDLEYSEEDYWKEIYKLGKITKDELFLKLL